MYVADLIQTCSSGAVSTILIFGLAECRKQLTIDIFSMKSAFFECSKHITPFSLYAKVHKSVGFGSAERCNDNVNFLTDIKNQF